MIPGTKQALQTHAHTHILLAYLFGYSGRGDKTPRAWWLGYDKPTVAAAFNHRETDIIPAHSNGHSLTYTYTHRCTLGKVDAGDDDQGSDTPAVHRVPVREYTASCLGTTFNQMSRQAGANGRRRPLVLLHKR